MKMIGVQINLLTRDHFICLKVMLFCVRLTSDDVNSKLSTEAFALIVTELCPVDKNKKDLLLQVSFWWAGVTVLI